MIPGKPPHAGRKDPHIRRRPSANAFRPSRKKDQIARTGHLAISDHATLPYLERFEGVDLAAARQRLKRRLDTVEAKPLIAFAGGSPYRIRVEGATFCLWGGRVLTCYP